MKRKNYKKRNTIKEEDIETTIPSSTPTGNTNSSSSNVSLPLNSLENNKDDKNTDEPDPAIEYILQQLQKNKGKQIQDAQLDYNYRQHQANQIVSDIENYLKQNKLK